jgi:hypothetical protein
MWKSVWVTIIHRGGRGSEIVVRKIEGINGMLCWENGYLSSRENANLFQSGVLHSGEMGQARCWCDYRVI